MKKIIALSLAVALAGCASTNHYIYSSDVPANKINDKPNFNVPTYVCENNLRLDFDSTKKGTSEIRFEDFFGYTTELTQDAANPNHYYSKDNNVQVFKDKRNIVLSRGNSLVTCSQYIPNEEEEKALVKNTKKIALASGAPAKVINISRVIYLYSYAQQIAEARKNADDILAGKHVKSEYVAHKPAKSSNTKPAYKYHKVTKPVAPKVTKPVMPKATKPVMPKATKPVFHKSTTAPVTVYHKRTNAAVDKVKSEVAKTTAPVKQITPVATNIVNNAKTGVNNFHKSVNQATETAKQIPTTKPSISSTINGLVYSVKDKAADKSSSVASSSSVLSTAQGYLSQAKTAYANYQTAKLAKNTANQESALSTLKSLSDKASALKDSSSSSVVSTVIDQIKGLYNKAVGK